MRTYASRLLISTSGEGVVSVGLAEDRFVRGQRVGSDLLRLQNVGIGDLAAELEVCMEMLNRLAWQHERALSGE